MTAWEVELDPQSGEFRYNYLSLLAGIVVRDVNGEELARCPDAVLLEAESRHRKEYTLADTFYFANRKTFRRHWSLNLTLLEDCTLKDTLAYSALDELDPDAILKAVHKKTRNVNEVLNELLYNTPIKQYA